MILVSGATGKIGSELVRLLRERDIAVRALVRTAAKAAPLEALGTQTVLGEFDDEDALAVALLGVDRFFVVPVRTWCGTTRTRSARRRRRGSSTS